MRVLVTIAHYSAEKDDPNWHLRLGSASFPMRKIAALNAQIVALNQYFGPRRLSFNPDDVQGRSTRNNDVLDIVVMTKRDANLLESIGIDPTTYTVDYFDGPPLMLPFEAQRIMRERVGQYDMYAYMEDDLVVDDPAFFTKIAWFAAQFGPQAMLLPIRYELASTGVPAKVSLSMQLGCDLPEQREFPAAVTGRWNGVEQTFRRPNNPHAGCYALTDEQLRHWIAQPSYYDRDASWIDPLVSAATYAPGKVFGLYMPAEPDPWFLQIEHYGARYAASLAPAGQVYGEPLLLTLLEASLQSDADSPRQILASLGKPGDSFANRAAEAARLREELGALQRSRSRLFKALLATMWRKARH